ncbi:MAG: hypothetical protein LBP89_10450 [Helicobacteraceae bacterium]|jgi:hypothetical protein|nr:hypothetical protein [Helicobacteraceae bacterium]
MANGSKEAEILQEIEQIDKRAFWDSALFKKLFVSIALIALLIFSFWGAARERSFDYLFAPLDQKAEEYLERTLIKTAFTYASVRAAHAVVSLFKGTQVHPPFATISVGELLSPVLDMIEKLSDALMVAIASLGAQRIIMEIGGFIGLSFFVSAGSVLLLAGVWITKFKPLLFSCGARLVVFGLAARLMIPLIACGASIASETLLQNKYEEAISGMEVQRGAFSESVLPSDGSGFMDKVKKWASLDALSARIDALKNVAEELTKNFIALFTLFVFETIVFPIASLWILLRIFYAFIPLNKD